MCNEYEDSFRISQRVQLPIGIILCREAMVVYSKNRAVQIITLRGKNGKHGDLNRNH